ncbi:hypothetical protein HYV12_01290 [Candidatus Dojkabacteria bacterium]|nr:hypothetical protein [Candidatus Dojkabacteria bacterium]
MDINERLRNMVEKLPEGSFTFYDGMHGYTIPLLLRIQSGEKHIKQIINGHKVAKFHKKTDMMVREVISTRVEKGISIQNLICSSDSDLEIERSNPKTLKQARIMPEGYDAEVMFAIFGDTVTYTSLDSEHPWGVVIKDPSVVAMANQVYDMIWNLSRDI